MLITDNVLSVLAQSQRFTNMRNIFPITALVLAVSVSANLRQDELTARQFLNELNERALKRYNRAALANWAYATNITSANLKHKLDVQAQLAKETKEDWLAVATFPWRRLRDYDLVRQFEKHSVLGTAALPEREQKQFGRLVSEMQRIYSTAKVRRELALDPDLTEILARSGSPEEMKRVWVEWRNAVGPRVRGVYGEYVRLSNEAARANNFTDNAQYWQESYEADGFKEEIGELWRRIRPLYLEIHAYARHRLRRRYGGAVSRDGPIPAHLLGNMWAQSWTNIGTFTAPFPGKTVVDIGEELQKQNYTPVKIFETAEEFFVSLNLSAMPPSFWRNSLLEKPTDRDIVCHPSAWDFYDGEDFRIKQCTEPTQEHFKTAHHEMGHVQYYLRYKHRPVKYRRGANNGFHEAVGDVIALSAQTNKHLRKLGLLRDSQDDDVEAAINHLYQVGLSKVVFLPFAYAVDSWRWAVFEGKIAPEDYNCAWWKLRNDLQGLEPPVHRSERDFDVASKYHVVANVPYIRYFVSYVVQFQFHRALCEKAGRYGPGKPLHECDIHGSKAAGNALGEMLSMGASRPWPDALEVLTGERKMDAGGLLEYFRPLYEFLVDYNRKHDVFVGWTRPGKVCLSASRKGSTDETRS